MDAGVSDASGADLAVVSIHQRAMVQVGRLELQLQDGRLHAHQLLRLLLDGRGLLLHCCIQRSNLKLAGCIDIGSGSDSSRGRKGGSGSRFGH